MNSDACSATPLGTLKDQPWMAFCRLLREDTGVEVWCKVILPLTPATFAWLTHPASGAMLPLRPETTVGDAVKLAAEIDGRCNCRDYLHERN